MWNELQWNEGQFNDTTKYSDIVTTPNPGVSFTIHDEPGPDE